MTVPTGIPSPPNQIPEVSRGHKVSPLVVLLLLGLLAMTSLTIINWEARENLQSELSRFQSEIDTLNNQLGTARTSVTDTSLRLSEVQARIAQLQRDLDQLESENSLLISQNTQLRTQIDELQSQLDNLRITGFLLDGLYFDPTIFYDGNTSCVSNSMYPTITCEDTLVFHVPQSSTEIQVGTIIVYHIPSHHTQCDFAGLYILHRVVRITWNSEFQTSYFWMKGDSNSVEDDCGIPFSMIVSEVVGVVYG